jgi:hypothetical protein
MVGLHYHLDAVRLLEGAGRVGEQTRAAFRAWLGERLEWLSGSPEGIAARRAGDHRGTRHDLQVASIAAFLDDQDRLYDALVRAQSRIRGQFGPEGCRPGGPEGAAAMHWRCCNLQAWVDLAELASRWGVDLWAYRAPDDAGLGQGVRRLLSGGDIAGPGEQADGFDAARLQPIRFAAIGHVDDLPRAPEPERGPYACKPVFPPADGIRPYWNLAGPGRPGELPGGSALDL